MNVILDSEFWIEKRVSFDGNLKDGLLVGKRIKKEVSFHPAFFFSVVSKWRRFCPDLSHSNSLLLVREMRWIGRVTDVRSQGKKRELEVARKRNWANGKSPFVSCFLAATRHLSRHLSWIGNKGRLQSFRSNSWSYLQQIQSPFHFQTLPTSL